MAAARRASLGGARRNYCGRTVQEVYASSVQLALASCEGRGPTVQHATEAAVKAVLQALRLLPTGRWIPTAAVAILVRAIAGKRASMTTEDISSAAANAAMKLLSKYGILTQEDRSVFRPAGASHYV
jgi:hypothetical protein